MSDTGERFVIAAIYGAIVTDASGRLISPEERPDLYPQISEEQRAERRLKYLELFTPPEP